MTCGDSSGSDTDKTTLRRQPRKLGSYGVEYFLREPSPPVNEVIYCHQEKPPLSGEPYHSESLDRVSIYRLEASYKISRFNEITRSAVSSGASSPISSDGEP